MKGFPQTWNTKQDVLLCLERWPEQTKQALRQFLDNRMDWMIQKKLADNEKGMEDKIRRVRQVADEDGTVVERYQMEWREDPNARLFRLGFTRDEAASIISG